MFKTIVEHLGGPETTARQFRQLWIDECKREVDEWHRRYLPLHFETSASKRYGYQPRTARYMKAKARRKNHQRPLTWSSQMAEMVQQSVRIEASRSGAKGILHGPRYLYQFNKKVGAPDKAKEITATIPEEIRDMGERIKRRMAIRMQRDRTRLVRHVA